MAVASEGFEIRMALPQDVPAIHQLIRELAEYEREPDSVVSTVADLEIAFFRDNPAAYCHVALVDGHIVGIAIWFLNFSTWTGSHGIYLEDLYVRPAQRGLGIGKELLATLARTCVSQGYQRLEWAVLDWNEPALGFYRALGAKANDEWTVFRLAGEALTKAGV